MENELNREVYCVYLDARSVCSTALYEVVNNSEIVVHGVTPSMVEYIKEREGYLKILYLPFTVTTGTKVYCGDMVGVIIQTKHVNNYITGYVKFP